LLWSLEIWMLLAPLEESVLSCSSAAVTDAAAAVRCETSAASSIDASGVPTETFWPAVTYTCVTVPDTAKLRFALCAGSTVPEAETVCWIVEAATVYVVVALAALLEDRVNHHVPVPPTTTTTAAARASVRFFGFFTRKQSGPLV
jgi:hypothetical protein